MGIDRASIGYPDGVNGVSIGYPECIDTEPSRVDKPTLRAIYKTIARHTISYPATKAELKIWTGKKDRVIRRGIEDLRNMGIKIVSLSDRYGYWLDSKGGGYDRMKAEMRSRAFAILRTISRMDGELEGQLEWDAEHGSTVESGMTLES